MVLKPKRAIVPFMYFVKEHSKQVMSDHKQRTIAGAVKLLAKDWKKMTEQEKSKYIELSVADRRRHLEQCQQMKDKGYFITDDGRISSEIL